MLQPDQLIHVLRSILWHVFMIVLVLLSMLRISLLVRYLSTITFLQHANKEHYSTQILSLINCLSLAGVTQLHNSTLDKCRDVLLILIFTQHTTEYYLGSYFSLSLAGCLAELKQYLVIIIPRGLKLLYTLAVGVKVLRGTKCLSFIKTQNLIYLCNLYASPNLLSSGTHSCRGSDIYNHFFCRTTKISSKVLQFIRGKQLDSLL
jgi:hypothetical protein